MRKLFIHGREKYCVVAALFIVSCLASLVLSFTNPTNAATFSMQSGYYVGTGTAGKAISGLGFRPDLVIIKAKSGATATASNAVFYSKAMPSTNAAYFSAIADSTVTPISPSSDGFTLSSLAAVNTANVIYTWTAFTGSDCTAGGTFCVGTYNGDGSATRTITTGFQPDIIFAKRSNSSAAHFRTASMSALQSSFFNTATDDTTGSYIANILSNGFSVGATDNTTNGVYYYIAFKSGAGVAEGRYTGNAIDNRDINGLSFKPDMVMIKNNTSTTSATRNTVWSTNEHTGDATSFIGEAVSPFVDMPDYIQKLNSDGFQVGTAAGANENGATIYWFAFGGVPIMSGASGTFKMAVGTYSGTSNTQTISLPFAPDLVIIKDSATNQMVFRTSLMTTNTAYIANPASDFTNGITALNNDSFNLGTSSIVNGSTRTYQWQAFGNAYRPDKKKGAADFAIGAYQPTGITDTVVSAVPYPLDFVTVKRASTTAAAFRSSSQSGNLSAMFTNTAETSGMIKALTANGFQVGADASVNATGAIYRWFGFKSSSNFAVGNYTGTSNSNQTVTLGTGMPPDLVWVKSTAATAPVSRPSSLTGDSTQRFDATADSQGIITSLTSSGMVLGATTTYANTSGQVYRYAAWKIPPPGVLTSGIVDASGSAVSSPNFTMNPAQYPFGCDEVTGILGTASQKIRVSNMSTTAAWTMSIAATDGPSGAWKNHDLSQQYDYNESSGSPGGCSDGTDIDNLAGRLGVEPSGGIIIPQPGCTNSGVSLGSNTSFNEANVDAITLMSATSSASTSCYWDLTNVMLRQYIPQAQASESYSIDLTITTVAP